MGEEGEDLSLRERLERRIGASAARRRGAFAVEEEGGLDGGPAENQACQKLAAGKSTNAEAGKGVCVCLYMYISIDIFYIYTDVRSHAH